MQTLHFIQSQNKNASSLGLKNIFSFSVQNTFFWQCVNYARNQRSPSVKLAWKLIRTCMGRFVKYIFLGIRGMPI